MDRELLEFLKSVGGESLIVDMGVNAETGENEWLKSPRPGKGVCDFCSSTPVVCVFEAGEIRFETVPDMPDFGSRDAWSACAECKPLVEKEKRGALLDRCAQLLAVKRKLPIGLARQLVKEIHSAFWKARENRSGS